MRVRLDHVLSELILEQSSLSREFPPWNDPSWSCRRNRPHHLQKGCRAVQHVSPHHCFQETSGGFSPFLAARTLDCGSKQDTWPTVTRGFCADAKTEDELGVLTTWDWKLNPKKPNLWHTEIKALDVVGVLLTCVCLFSASHPATLHLTDSDRTSNIKIL